MYKMTRKELEERRNQRGRYLPEVRWYAVAAHCGRERRVCQRIREDLDETAVAEILLPEVRSEAARTGTRPHGARSHGAAALPRLLFPSYLFLRCAMNDEIYGVITEYPDVHQILGNAHRIPTALDDEEITHLKGILLADCNPQVVPKVHIGDEARVIVGLMQGAHGRVIEQNAREVKLQVSFSFLDMGTGVSIIVPKAHVQILDPAEAGAAGDGRDGRDGRG